MSPGGAVEEVGKVAGGFIDVMRSQPLALALVLMNLALLGVFFYVTNVVAKQREREVTMMYTDQKEVRELLSHCVAPAKKEGDS